MRSVRRMIGIGTVLLLVFFGVLLVGHAAGEQKPLPQPIYDPINNEGEKWRIGYVETDPYVNFAGTLSGILYGLEQLGWLQNLDGLPYEMGQVDSKRMWDWLQENDTGPYLEFVADAHYSLIDAPDLDQQVIERLTTDQDLDLLLLMGTSSGQLIATGKHDTPSLVFSSSNAVLSGIIESEHDSGIDHVWAHMDAHRYKRQLEVFHDIFEFEKLALVYEDSPLGRVYAAVEDVEEMANELGFETLHYHVDEPAHEDDQERYEREMKAAFASAAASADAFYLTAGTWDLNTLPELLEPFYDHQVPVFSQIGANDVRYGALMSLYRAHFNGVGLFGAQTIARVLNGELPRNVPQIYGDTPSIVLNLEVADRISYQVPFDILLVADRVYQEIGGE